jgi:hypothetical protein
MSFNFLVECLRDRAITARSLEDYAALGDMAHGAALCTDSAVESSFLVQIREAARELENTAVSRRWHD